MNARKIMVCGAGALTTVCLSLPAYAQQSQRPLSMTYQILGINAEAAKPAPTVADRCSPLTWVASLGACGGSLAEDTPQSARAARADAERQDAPLASARDALAPTRVASDPATPRSVSLAPVELPSLGSNPEPRVARAASGRAETLLGSSRTADLLLRVGSKHRLRSNDESFTDANYQAHVQNNSHKALGVELMVPFQ